MKAATFLIKTDRLHAVIFGMNTLKEKKKGTIITVFAAIVFGCTYANHKCKNFIRDTRVTVQKRCGQNRNDLNIHSKGTKIDNKRS